MNANQTPREGEPQYEEVIAAIRRRGMGRLGLMTSWAWLDDPKRLTFMLARYKFAARMLAGCDRIVEVGCGDGFGSRIVAQDGSYVTAVDFDPELLDSARATADERFHVEFLLHNVMKDPIPGRFSGAYSMDVLEHIKPEDEDLFLANVVASLNPNGVFVVGTPSLESQVYASKFSKMGHVNCKTQFDLKKTMLRHFQNVFMFSMNDEVVHTGYSKMSHYNIALCCNQRIVS